MKIYQIKEHGYGRLEIFFTSEDAAKEYCAAQDKERFDWEKTDAETAFDRAMKGYREEKIRYEITLAAAVASAAAAQAKSDELGVELPRRWRGGRDCIELFEPTEPKPEDYPAFDPESFKPAFSYVEIEIED